MYDRYHIKETNNRQQKKSKKQDKIANLLNNSIRPISYKEISEACNCTKRYVKMVVKSLVIQNKVSKKSTEHSLNSYKGKNLYRRPIINVMCQKNTCQNEKPQKPYFQPIVYEKSTKKQPQKSYSRRSNPHQKFHHIKEYNKNLYKYKFAKDQHRNFSRKFFTKEQKFEILKLYGFEKHAEQAPQWWFRDLSRLKSALRQLRAKLRKSFKCKDFFKFISFLLKRGTFGYRRHVARNTTLSVTKPTLKRIEPYLETEARANGYEALKELYNKHNLDMSFGNMQKLLRKGFGHLTVASTVMLKRLKIPGVENINAFLHHLISMKEPYEILRSNQNG